jgi:hypothetical protein
LRALSSRARKIRWIDFENRIIPSASAANAKSGYETSVRRQKGNHRIAIAISQIGRSAATGARALIAAESTWRRAVVTRQVDQQKELIDNYHLV